MVEKTPDKLKQRHPLMSKKKNIKSILTIFHLNVLGE